MALTSHNSRWLLLALPFLSAIAGCCCEAFPLAGECSCPTDARRMYCGAGEEAVRRCPCGPDCQFYGLKPTEWRTWPEGWRCGQYAGCAAPVESSETPSSVPNPFREPAVEEMHRSVPPPEAAPHDKQPAKDEPSILPPLPSNSAPATTTTPDAGTTGTHLTPVEPAPLNLPPSDFSLPPANINLPPIPMLPSSPGSPLPIPPQSPPIETHGTNDGPPASKRVAEHLSHNLAN